MIEESFKLAAVSTAVDTQKAVSGSIVVVGNSLVELRNNFQNCNYVVLYNVLSNRCKDRYVVGDYTTQTAYNLCYVVSSPELTVLDDEYTRLSYNEMRIYLEDKLTRVYAKTGYTYDWSSVKKLSEIPGILDNLRGCWSDAVVYDKEEDDPDTKIEYYDDILSDLFEVYFEYQKEWLEKKCNNELLLLQRQLYCYNMCCRLADGFDASVWLSEITTMITEIAQVKDEYNFEWFKV